MPSSNEFTPDWYSPPGDTIADILHERGLSAEQFADQMGYRTARANNLLDGEEEITAETARKLEVVLGAPARFWMIRELQYREDVSRLCGKAESAVGHAWLKNLPLKDMVKFRWIDAPTITACLHFFDVPNPSAWFDVYDRLLQTTAFHTSPTFDSQIGAVAAWLRQAEIQSASINCLLWDSKRFQEILPSIRALTRTKDPNNFIPELTRHCSECGVALVILRSPSGCRASGATRFLSPQKTLLQLSFRYLSDDQFWFTFFHEAAHLILHSDNAMFLESPDLSPSREENEASEFAGKILIPAEFTAELMNLPVDGKEVIRFARTLGISPGIVVGQLQHHGRFSHRQLNNLKRRFVWKDN